MKLGSVRLLLGAVAVLALVYADHRASSADVMSDAANHLLQSLTEEQRAKAVFPMDDDEGRTFWQYIPSLDVARRFDRPRPGLTLLEMTPEQRQLAAALLTAGLSRDGYIKARSIMSLEDVLLRLENESPERRNPLRYHFSIFGTPASDGVWGYRIEGHHLSLHYTVVDGKLAGAPTFFGSNPREILEGPRKGFRALPREEDVGRKLAQSLNEEQFAAALVSERAYRDILTTTSRVAALDEEQPKGLPVSKLTAAQRETLDELVEIYADSMPPEIAARRLEQYRAAGDDMYFAWAGVTEVGGPHYYRIQAPSFLIEYDCTQNQANHIHTVWRDYKGDFGRDLLAEHMQSSHRR